MDKPLSIVTDLVALGHGDKAVQFMPPSLVAKWEAFKKIQEVSNRLGDISTFKSSVFFEWVEQQKKEETADEKN